MGLASGCQWLKDPGDANGAGRRMSEFKTRRHEFWSGVLALSWFLLCFIWLAANLLAHAPFIKKPHASLGLERTQKLLQPPGDSTDRLSTVRGSLETDNDAIALYRKLVKACGDTDCVTQDLAVEILAGEEEHRWLFEGAGHIAGATNINFQATDFSKQIAALPRSKTY